MTVHPHIQPRPIAEPIALTSDGCDARFAVCLDADNAMKLERYLRAIDTWARETEIMCKSEETK